MNKVIVWAIVGLLIVSVVIFLNEVKPVYAQEYTFDPAINLTENGNGLFPKVAASRNNVYVLWGAESADSLFGASADNGASFRDPVSLDLYGTDMVASENNLYIIGIRSNNILFKSSNDNGKTFNEAIDLSNNAGASLSPHIAVSGSDIYVVWEDDGPGNPEILFTASKDKGTNFSKMINLSKSSLTSTKPQIAASGKNVYVAWAEVTDHDRVKDEIFLRASNDRGVSFADTINISKDSTMSLDPLIAASGSDVYVAWVDVHKNDIGFWESDVLLKASHDGGANFGDVINLTENLEAADDPQLAASGDNVYVAWNTDNTLCFRASNANGRTFGDAIKLRAEVGLEGLQWQPKISLAGKNVYLLWTDESDVFFTASNDYGRTFGDVVGLTSEGGSGSKDGIDLASYGKNVYAVWHDLGAEGWEILFRAGSAKPASPPEWYLGESLQQGLLVKYKISYLDYKNGQPFNATLWFGSQDDRGDWIVDVIVEEEGKVVNGTLKLSSLNLTPLATNISPELEPYILPIRNSLFLLGEYAPRTYPGHLYGNKPWGIPVACLGCGVLVSTMGTETIEAAGKTWDTHIVGWHYALDSKFWIRDDFPLPIKAKVYTITTVLPLPVQFEFELLENSISDAIPEFPVNLMVITAAGLIGVLVALRAKRKELVT